VNCLKSLTCKTLLIMSRKTKSGAGKSFKTRKLTLLRKDWKRDENDEIYYIPTVTLAGQWLYDAGFRSGQRVELVVENRRIVMRVESEPCDGPSKEQLTLQIKRLERQLRQLPDETEINQPVRARKVKRNSSQHRAVFAE